MGLTPIVLAISPFVLFLILLLWKKTSLVWISFFVLIIVSITSLFYWGIYPSYFIGSYVKGFLIAFDIFLIILGAIFFLEVIKEAKVIENSGYYLESISKDLRVQVIFLAWFFEGFLEGTAGFGTPAAVVAPLLVGLGISPIKAVIIALLGNSTPGVFGAVGTPIKVGFGELAGMGLPLKAALLNLVGIFVPVFMLWILTRGKKNGDKEFIEALPFAIWAGIAFLVPSVFAVLLGQEFGSILGSAAGLILVFITTKLKILIPKREENLTDRPRLAYIPLYKVIFPYLALVLALITGKVILGSTGFQTPLIIKHTFSYFNPGFAFIAVSIVSLLFFKIKTSLVGQFFKTAFRGSIVPFLVILFMSTVSQIMVYSVHNPHGLLSMVDYLANSVKNVLLPFWAPIVGAFGGFLTGSVTVSNVMFGNFLATSARDLGLNVDTILALAVVGAGGGNMIALADVIVAEAIVGLKNEERKVLAGEIIPCLIYIILVGIIGFWITR